MYSGIFIMFELNGKFKKLFYEDINIEQYNVNI